MKCSNCNFENRADARFCKRCGQPLPAQPTPSATPPPPGAICPACGATAKPGARFCPRCGKPLAAPPPAPAQPLPMTATQPSMGALPQPYGPPPAAPAQPKRRPSRWPLWVGGIFVFLCIVAIIVAAVILVPKYVGGEETPAPTTAPATEAPPTAPVPPTDTPSPPPPTELPPTEEPPPPAFDAQVTITASTPELRVGEILTVTVTVSNTGDVPFGNLRYQLVGEWKPHLELAAETEEMVIHEEVVHPEENNVATFVLRAIREGEIRLEAYVMMDVHTDPPSGESRLSDKEIIVRVNP